MKKEFFDLIISLMKKDERIWFISIGLGWPRTDELKEKFPTRYIQTEAAEQTALDIAVGLSYSGKIPFTYTISPFYYRAFETIRTYINHEKLNIKMIGAGRDDEYSRHDGYSHDACDIPVFFREFKNIIKRFPDSFHELQSNMDECISTSSPYAIFIHK